MSKNQVSVDEGIAYGLRLFGYLMVIFVVGGVLGYRSVVSGQEGVLGSLSSFIAILSRFLVIFAGLSGL